jgi:hypothetical protein
LYVIIQSIKFIVNHWPFLPHRHKLSIQLSVGKHG